MIAAPKWRAMHSSPKTPASRSGSAIPTAPGSAAATKTPTVSSPVSPQGYGPLAVSQHQLNEIAERLNNRPRKVLGFKTPNEVFARWWRRLRLRSAVLRFNLTPPFTVTSRTG